MEEIWQLVVVVGVHQCCEYTGKVFLDKKLPNTGKDALSLKLICYACVER